MNDHFSSYSLFQEPWWLDAASPGGWDEVRVEQGGEVRARLPYVVQRRAGLTRIGAPPLTKTLGPWIAPSEAKYANALSTEMDSLEELVARLPRHDVFRQAFAPEQTNWLPFYWAGFEASARLTYRITDLTNADALWKGLRENIRREIRKAERHVEVVDDLDLDQFIRVASKTFERQGLSRGFDEAALRRIDDAAAARDARRILFAVDEGGAVHAGAYFVWDERVAYYLLGGGDPQLRTSGASSLLMWSGIRHAATTSRVFDFEGSMLRPVERFFRAFGARQTPFLVATRRGRRASLLSAAARAAQAVRGR